MIFTTGNQDDKHQVRLSVSSKGIASTRWLSHFLHRNLDRLCIKEFLLHRQSLERGSWEAEGTRWRCNLGFGKMCREGKLAGRSVRFSWPPCALRQFLHFPALLKSEICSASAGRGPWGRRLRGGGGGWWGRSKRHILDFVIPPQENAPCLAWLGAWRFTAEDSQSIARSMFTAKTHWIRC